jgi:fluoroquinolone transport system permease protein
VSAATTVWANDLRNIVRDRTVGVLLVVPAIFLVLLRFGVPWLEDRWTVVGGHRVLILAVLSAMAGMFPAFMVSFIMLDERDQGLFAAFRILPVATGRLLGYRVAGVAALGLIYPALLIPGSGLGSYGFLETAVLSFLCAVGGPAALMVAVALAKNKIECLAAYKLLFLVTALGAVGVLGDQHGWSRPSAALPSYWVFMAFDAPGARGLMTDMAAALGLYACVLAVFYRRFRRSAL